MLVKIYLHYFILFNILFHYLLYKNIDEKIIITYIIDKVFNYHMYSLLSFCFYFDDIMMNVKRSHFDDNIFGVFFFFVFEQVN